MIMSSHVAFFYIHGLVINVQIGRFVRFVGTKLAMNIQYY